MLLPKELLTPTQSTTVFLTHTQDAHHIFRLIHQSKITIHLSPETRTRVCPTQLETVLLSYATISEKHFLCEV